MTASGCTTRPNAIVKSWEREITEDALRPSCNIFDRLERSRGEDMRTHLDVRNTSVTSKRREDLQVVYPINDEINELKARLKTLAARNTEATQSTSTSSSSAEI